jgi:DNA invertase Pin-like site-specific DNA recombinase
MQHPNHPDAPAPARIADAGGGRPVRALIAARLSQLQRDGRRGIGIDTQDEKSRVFCEQHGMIVVDVIADTKSGTVAPWDRKNLKPWVTDPDLISLYDVIVAYATDRLSRGNQVDFTRIEFWAVQHGKRLIIVDGPQYPARQGSHDSDYWQWHAEKMVARKEWEADRERTLRATDKLRRENKFVGKVPWGFTVEGPKYDKSLVPTEQGRRYIPVIYDMVIEGRSLTDICAWLDSLHLKQEKDKETGELVDVPWWPSAVAKMLRNPVYRGRYWMSRTERDPETGEVTWRGRWEHSCEPLIDARRFRLAGEAISAREKRGPAGTPQSRAMLKGAIMCPACEGSPMYKITTRGSSKAASTATKTYYRCAGTGPRRGGCGNMARLDLVDTAVDEIMATTFDTPVKRLILIKGTDHTEALEEVMYRIRDLDPHTMTDQEYDTGLHALRGERDRLKALPAVPDRWEEQLTAERYSGIYAALPAYERGGWLKKHGFLVHATKHEVTVIQGETEGTLSLT